MKITLKIPKSLFRSFLIFLPLLAASLAVGQLNVASAAFLPGLDEFCNIFPCPGQDESGIEIAKTLTGRIIDNVRFIIGAVAVTMIIIAGVKLVTSQGNEEVYTKQVQTLTYAIIGLVLVGLAGELAAVLEVGRGGFLKDPNVIVQKNRIFSRLVEVFITLVKYLIGSVAVLMIVRNGIRLVLLGGNEEEVTKDKKNIFYSLLGLIIILISNPIINKVFFKIDTRQYPGLEPVRPAVDPKRLVAEIAGMTNVVAAIAGPFALLSLVIGGVMYVFAGGDEEKTGKAKKIILWSLAGLVLIYGAFAIVSTFVAREFEGI